MNTIFFLWRSNVQLCNASRTFFLFIRVLFVVDTPCTSIVSAFPFPFFVLFFFFFHSVWRLCPLWKVSKIFSKKKERTRGMYKKKGGIVESNTLFCVWRMCDEMGRQSVWWFPPIPKKKLKNSCGPRKTRQFTLTQFWTVQYWENVFLCWLYLSFFPPSYLNKEGSFSQRSFFSAYYIHYTIFVSLGILGANIEQKLVLVGGKINRWLFYYSFFDVKRRVEKQIDVFLFASPSPPLCSRS